MHEYARPWRIGEHASRLPLVSADTNNLRRAWLRGFRQGDVELALARGTLLEEQLQHELEASKARADAMQTEITELHRRLESFRQQEHELKKAVDQMRDRREQAEHDAQTQAETIVGEAEQRAAAQRVTQDIADALDRLGAAPARAVEQIPPHPAAEPAAGDADERFVRWSDSES
jgi:uncharacterized coiled-coil DUF342 family protein